jgi:hypothetical protein
MIKYLLSFLTEPLLLNRHFYPQLEAAYSELQHHFLPIPLASRSKARVCGRACWDCGFESRQGIDVCLL